jgi:endonuclease-3
VNRRQRAARIAEILTEAYPEAACELEHESPWQLLVATVLSAQCTDSRVNGVTPGLFARWPGPRELAAAPLPELEAAIRPTGMHRRKAAALRQSARVIVERHGGEVPRTIGELAALPGVGPKTAKVVLGEGFRIAAGVTVDTHVRRLSRRLGLSRLDDPERIAAELEASLPREKWIRFSTRLILHGRRVCTARAPRCDDCALEAICPKVGTRRSDV